LIGNTELIALLIINIVIIMIIYFSFQTLKIFLFDEEFSTVRNIPIKLMNITFYILIALTIIIILSIVGIVLLIAFLTLPAAISLFYQKTIKNTMIMSGIIIASTNTLGLFIAHFINLPPGPIIIMMLSLLYLISFGYETVKKKYYEKKNPIESHSCGVEIESFGIFQDYIKDGKYLEENDHIKFHKDQGKCD